MSPNRLGAFLRGRRAKLDPATVGFAVGRRRTPGLRREEVAQRANISTTWYICLEQGRGGAPSPDVLDRIAQALLLTEAEREHLYLLASGRPPELYYKTNQGIESRLQRLLDVVSPAPALIKTPTWDVIAWNAAAAAVFVDYESIAPQQRNLLRIFFLNSRARSVHYDWENVARAAVASFRAEVAKAGAMAQASELVDDLIKCSPDFSAIWSDSDVVLGSSGLVKHVRHPILGPVSFECSTLAVDGRQDLTMLAYVPTEEHVTLKIRDLIASGRHNEESQQSDLFGLDVIQR